MAASQLPEKVGQVLNRTCLRCALPRPRLVRPRQIIHHFGRYQSAQEKKDAEQSFAHCPAACVLQRVAKRDQKVGRL